MRITYAQADGNALILPRKRGETEELEIVVMLRRDDLAVLKEDEVWQHSSSNIL